MFLVPTWIAAWMALVLVPISANAATSCFSESCGSVCTPDLPVGISTIVTSDDFAPTGVSTPIAFADPDDGRNRRLIATQEGAILMWDAVNREILPTFFLDLRDEMGGPVLAGGERGLLSLALDPDYANTGEFYVYYTAASSGPGSTGDIVVARYTRSAGNPDVGDAGSAETILVVEHSSASNHNGGWLAFGPDGFLYITTGDGGGGCDSNQGTGGDGQRSDTLLGKMLRIDVRGVDGSAGVADDCGVEPGDYGIPSTNPFIGQEPACDEVWALGLRNPFRFSFDRATGDLYLGDVGQNSYEEIDYAPSGVAGLNFGWARFEGVTANCPHPLRSGSTHTPPIFVADRFRGATGLYADYNAMIGGVVYRGSTLPELQGVYVFGDYVGKRMASLRQCGSETSPVTPILKRCDINEPNSACLESLNGAPAFSELRAVVEDHAGELYVVANGNSLLKVVPLQ